MIPRYRAFYKANQKMYEVLTLDIIDEKVLIENNDNPKSPLIGYVKITETELMQSTGLKDKNGVEIYEGDVVDVGTRIPFLNKIQKDEETNYLKLVPIDERWTESYFTSFEDKSRFEILGNIYENPELLEVE